MVCAYNYKLIKHKKKIILELIFEFTNSIIDIILNAKNIDPRLLNKENMTPFDAAIKNSNYNTAKYLVSHPKYKESLFYY
jgi:hypothetical protein